MHQKLSKGYWSLIQPIHLDDIITISETPKEYLQRLRGVLEELSKAGFKLEPRKCDIFKTSLRYLGNVVFNNGIEAYKKKVEAITNCPIPVTVEGVRSFLGLTNYHTWFIPRYAHIVRPLKVLTSVEYVSKENKMVYVDFSYCYIINRFVDSLNSTLF